MLDKRCRYKVRELSRFYLFVKHKKIYYAYYPEYQITKSTGCTTLHDAYRVAWEIYPTLGNLQNKMLYKPLVGKKLNRDLKRALQFVDTSKPLTSYSIKVAQDKMLKVGMSGKSINNYIYLIRRSYTQEFPKWTPLEYSSVYRSCFPVQSFYHFWQKCNSRLHYLAFFAMTTGCRVGEIYNCEKITRNENLYLQINGTKTKNAVRIVPVLPETIACLEYLEAGFRTAAYKESVVEAGSLCGYDLDYIESNHIVFHSFRKMYKTLLESCSIPNSFIEYYMGHSQTNTVNKLYFIGSSADDSEVYPKVIEALRRFI